MSDTIVSW